VIDDKVEVWVELEAVKARGGKDEAAPAADAPDEAATDAASEPAEADDAKK
jgi:hypothetical protein